MLILFRGLIEVPTFTAQFNAHTGKFAAASSRTPGHLSEYERMKRMSEFYFDVNKWEEDIATQHEEESNSGKKRKRPTKKDLVSAFDKFESDCRNDFFFRNDLRSRND